MRKRRLRSWQTCRRQVTKSEVSDLVPFAVDLSNSHNISVTIRCGAVPKTFKLCAADASNNFFGVRYTCHISRELSQHILVPLLLKIYKRLPTLCSGGPPPAAHPSSCACACPPCACTLAKIQEARCKQCRQALLPGTVQHLVTCPAPGEPDMHVGYLSCAWIG